MCRRSHPTRSFSTVMMALGLGLFPAVATGLPIYFAGTGSYYDYHDHDITWDRALVEASERSFMDPLGHDLRGFLATVTSQAEDDFLAMTFGREGWLGGTDQETEGVWKWVTGPETGQIFWDHGVTNIYANWDSGQPSNKEKDEDYLGKRPGAGGLWNDMRQMTKLQGYYVEFTGGAPPIPEPTTLGYLVVGGLAGFAGFARRRRKAT